MRAVLGLGLLGAIIAAIAGWVMNIVQLVSMADAGVTGMFILKIVGVFVAPLGAVLGWIG